MAKQRTLRRSHRNQVFEVVRRYGLDPTQFSWEDVSSSYHPDLTVSQIVHRESVYFFIFDVCLIPEELEFASLFNPALNYTEEIGREQSISWESQLRILEQWVQSVSKDLTQPDLWAEALAERGLVEAAGRDSEGDEERFNEQELERIRTWLRELQNYILSTQNVDEDVKEIIQRRFDYLGAAATRLSKKDFLTVCLGSLMGVFLTASIPPDGIRDIMRFAWESLKTFLKAMAFLPQPPLPGA